MSKWRTLKFALLAAAAIIVGGEATDEITGTTSFGLVSQAQAVVGRPLTPVSVAGVARRTTRRCAAGVYNC